MLTWQAFEKLLSIKTFFISLLIGVNMEFAAHGSYSIERENNILLVDAQGPFNEVTVKQYRKDIETYTQKMSAGPWASLISFRGSGVFTPEAEQDLIDTTRYRMDHGMIAVAAVITNSPFADILQMQLQRIYQACGVQFHFFSDQENAKLWLDSFIENHVQNVARA